MQVSTAPPVEWDSVFNFVSNDLYDRDDTSIPESQSPPRSSATPSSNGGSPAENTETIVSISTTFHPGANHSQSPPNMVLLSQDSVFFYVNSQKLLDASFNGFDACLPLSPPHSIDGQPPTIIIQEDSGVLNILLHTVYDMSCTQFSPPLKFITQAVECLRKYGLPPRKYITPHTPLYSLILSRASVFPIDLYAVASENDLPELATAISSHLLAFDLSNLTDEVSVKMGPLYLKRLCFLHLGRNQALKQLLLIPPTLHSPTAQCNFEQQQKLTSAWALATAYLAWDARPGQPLT